MSETLYCIEHLSEKDVSCFFLKAQEQFPYLFRDLDFYTYSKKLADCADFIVCRSMGQIAGVLAFYMNNGNFVYVTFVCVLKEFQRLSIFSNMLCQLESLAREKGYEKIRLEVAKENVSAQLVYLHKDFSIIEKGEKSFFLEKRISKRGG